MYRALTWFWNNFYPRTYGVLTAESIVILGLLVFSYRS